MGSAVSVARCSDDDAPGATDQPEAPVAEGQDAPQASSSAGQAESVFVRKDDDESAMTKLASEHEENNADAEEIPDPEEIGEEIEISTVPYDPRFPATNQARNCYTRYNEYYKCIADKDEDAPDCKFYQKAYRSICPSEWVSAWNEAREEGNWFGKY